jgi:hypothetical protein
MNIGVQRQLTRSLVVGAAYVDTESHALPFARDINYPVLTSTATSAGANILARRPNPLFGAILELDSDQKASYHGLQITSAMRMSHHVTFNAFYTLSKTNSSVQLYNSTTSGVGAELQQALRRHGAGDTDQRHVFSMSMTYKPITSARTATPSCGTSSTAGASRPSSRFVADFRLRSPTATSTPISMATQLTERS